MPAVKQYTNITSLGSNAFKSGRRGIPATDNQSPRRRTSRRSLILKDKDQSLILKDKDVPPPRQASSMTQSEVSRNLTIRGIKSSGMWEDDRETLQKEFFKEYKQRLKTRFNSPEDETQSSREIILNHVRRNSLEQEAKSKMMEQMKKTKEREEKLSMSEEHHALERRPDIKRWLDLVAQNKCDPSATFRMRPVLCRVVVKGLPPVSCLQSLNLSSNKLTDRVGSHIGNMVRINKSLTKLDLSGNLLGPLSIAQLGDALRENRTLRTLDLSSNPITVGNNGRDLVGVKVSEWIGQIINIIFQVM